MVPALSAGPCVFWRRNMSDIPSPNTPDAPDPDEGDESVEADDEQTDEDS